MALIDLSSDLSKFRSTVKSTNDTTPETSKVKSGKSFGALLPVTEKISQFSPQINKPKSVGLESRLSSTGQDDVVKKLKKDLIINSVSKYSPANASKTASSLISTPIESIVSKLASVKREQIKTRLDKSDVIIIRSELGTNNLNSPVDINTLFAKISDRKGNSPDILPIKQTDNKSVSSPSITIKKNDPSDDVVNPNIVINNIPMTFDRDTPDIFSAMKTQDKSVTSPNINGILQIEDKSKQSPNVLESKLSDDKSNQSPELIIQSKIGDKSTQTTDILVPNEIKDKSKQSPDVLGSKLSDDKSNQSPELIVNNKILDKIDQSPNINEPIQTSDKTGQSPDIILNTKSLDKSKSSPNIKPNKNDQSDNITDPKMEVFGKSLTFDRQGQSAIINKDLISPINNIINPNISLDENVLTFDRRIESPNILKNVKKSGFVTNPNTKVFRITQGTYHLKDESGLNRDEPPIKFVTNSNLIDKKTSLQKDNPKYNLETRQTDDHSNLNIDGNTAIKTNPSGRNDRPDKSILSIKGVQAVNFFKDDNAKGFVVKTLKGQTSYNQNSEFQWNGSRNNAPSINFITDTNATGFTKFVADSKYKLGSSVLDWDGNRQVAATNNGFKKFVEIYKSDIQNNPSIFVWKGNRSVAPSTDFFVNNKSAGFTKFSSKSEFKKNSSQFVFKGILPSPVNFLTDTNARGFVNKTIPLVTSYKKDTSKFAFKGDSKKAPSSNYFNNIVNDGFTKFATSLKSEFKSDTSSLTFKGNRQQAPSIDYFTNTNGAGFTNFAQELNSSFNKKPSRFTWVGDRQQAPEVDFFKIFGKNPNAIPGFTKLFIDKTATKLSDQYSGLSFAGTTIRSTVRPVPYTSFFGYTPYEKSGFMVNMSTFDGTLYPNIAPPLKYNQDAGVRDAIRQFRSMGGMVTENNEKYAPNSLGPRPWLDGTLSSTLDAQIPDGQIKTGAKAGSYSKKYETALKDSTDKLGFVTKWAITRHSPSPLDKQYNKFSLQKDSFNNDAIGLFRQPYIVRGIQRDGEVENQRWGFGVTLDDGIVRGGAVTQAERIVMDAYRILQWTTSLKGILFNVRQVGLQLMNPNVDVNPKKIESGLLGISATQIYNPIVNPMIINTVTARAGIHFARHGLLQFSSNFLNKYEDATLDRESNNKFIDPAYTAFKSLDRPTVYGQQTNYNRLIGLMKELLPNSFQPVITPAQTGDPVKNAVVNAALDIAKQLTGQSGIARLSSKFGGPQSFLGVGGTQISRPKHPYLTHYTTTPLLMLTGQQKEPQYQESAKRDTYYAATSMYKDVFNDELKTIAYNLPNGPYELNDESLPRSKSNIKNIQPSTINRIEKQEPFDQRYDLFKNRLRAVDATNVQKYGKSDGSFSSDVHPENVDTTNLLKQYRTLTYDKLGLSKDRKRSKNSAINTGDMNDFREDLLTGNDLAFSTDPAIADYANQNLEDKFGFGKHGKVGAKRNNPGSSNIKYGRTSLNYAVPKLKNDAEFRGDRINIIDYKKAKFDISKELVYENGKYNDASLPGADDLVEFYFTGVVLSGTDTRPAEAIVFRATFGNIEDNHNAEWTPIDYVGRADPLYVYKGYTRRIGFDFTVHIGSRDEMKATWRKLNHLASWTAPEYMSSGYMRSPIIRLNIGNLYRKMPGFLSTISYTFDNTETTWETAQLKYDQTITGPDGRVSGPGVLQLPKMIRVSCDFTPIGMYRPEYNGVMYSLYDDTNGGDLETGLIPKSDVKVNYFRTYELDANGNDETSDSSENQRYYRIKPGEETIIPEVKPENIEVMTQSNVEKPTNKTTGDVPAGGAPYDNTRRVPAYLQGEGEGNQ